jgi:hypothetical protein
LLLKMNARRPLPIVLGGPSGSGKSCLGKFLDENGSLHLEADLRDADGIDSLGLRDAWDAFYLRYDPVPLSQAMEGRRLAAQRNRVVLGLPSTPLSPAHLQKTAGVLLIRFLAGPAVACLLSFLTREAGGRATQVQLQAFWEHHNKAIMAALESPDYAGFILEAFETDGRRITVDVLARSLVASSRPSETA